HGDPSQETQTIHGIDPFTWPALQPLTQPSPLQGERVRVRGPGAQTERRGDAGPASGLLSGKDLAGRFSKAANLVVVPNRADASTLREQRIAAIAEQVEVECLVGLSLAIAFDFNRNGLCRLAGVESHRPGLSDVVVVARLRGAVHRVVRHRYRLVVGG